MAATKRKRFMVNIPPEKAPLVVARARQLNRSVANYLEWLVAEDLQAPYGGAEGGQKKFQAPGKGERPMSA